MEIKVGTKIGAAVSFGDGLPDPAAHPDGSAPRNMGVTLEITLGVQIEIGA